jgi:hypothetical protein
MSLDLAQLTVGDISMVSNDDNYYRYVFVEPTSEDTKAYMNNEDGLPSGWKGSFHMTLFPGKFDLIETAANAFGFDIGISKLLRRCDWEKVFFFPFLPLLIRSLQFWCYNEIIYL